MKLNYKLDINKRSSWNICLTNSVNNKMSFYIEEYGHFSAGSGYYTERQGQKNFLLLFTLSGTGVLNYNNQQYTLEPYHVAIIDCEKYHLYKTASSQQWYFKWFHFNGIAARDYFDLLFEEGYKPIQIVDPEEFIKKIECLFKTTETNNIKSIVLAASIISDIIAKIFDSKFSCGNIDKFSDHSREISKVIEFIEKNYFKEIALDDLTRAACLSKYHFSRLFKSHMGTSPYDFLINYRINESKILLVKTNLPISQICDETGFMDYNNYIRTFTKIVGMPPLKYRKSRKT